MPFTRFGPGQARYPGCRCRSILRDGAPLFHTAAPTATSQPQHIFPNGEAKPHSLTPGAKVESSRVTYPAPVTLFDLEGRREPT
jgi:hypothetical protein